MTDEEAAQDMVNWFYEYSNNLHACIHPNYFACVLTALPFTHLPDDDYLGPFGKVSDDSCETLWHLAKISFSLFLLMQMQRKDEKLDNKILVGISVVCSLVMSVSSLSRVGFRASSLPKWAEALPEG